MVAHLLRLKVALLRNSLKRSPWQLVGLIIGGLYGLGVLGLILVGLAVLGAGEPTIIGTVSVLGGAAVVLGWLIIPLVASGLDMTLDPARFTTFAIPLKTLLIGLALGSFIGIPGAITLFAAMGTAVSWWKQPGVAVLALLCGAMAALTCILASRAITAASTSLASSRRFKDVSGVVLMVPLVALGPILGSLTSGLSNISEFLPSLATTISWTPLGAVWAVPSNVAQGAYGAAAAKFLIALATMAVLAWIWKVCLAKALVNPPFAGGARRQSGKLGAFSFLPATPSGAVAARCLTYWFRDPRYSAGLVIAPLMPLIIVFASSQAGGFMDGGAVGVGQLLGSVLGFGGALATFLIVWSISADISYDNTAFALHLAAGVDGKADRGGRALAAGIIALPLGLLFAVVGAVMSGNWETLPGIVGLILGVVGAGLGLASVFSARFTMNVPLPGESPMKSKPGNNFASVLIQLGGFAGLGVLAAPPLILAIMATVTSNVLLSWLALATGVVLGALFLWLGLRLGARLYDRRAPELLLAVSADR